MTSPLCLQEQRRQWLPPHPCSPSLFFSSEFCISPYLHIYIYIIILNILIIINVNMQYEQNNTHIKILSLYLSTCIYRWILSELESSLHTYISIILHSMIHREYTYSLQTCLYSLVNSKLTSWQTWRSLPSLSKLSTL